MEVLKFLENKGIIEKITYQRGRFAEKKALEFGLQSMTYSELLKETDALAALLKSRCKPGSVIGVLLTPSLEMVIAFLAVLRSGHTYLPLDPDFPSGRTGFIMEDARCELLITEKGVTLPSFDCPVFYTDEALPSGDCEEFSVPAPGDIAYIIYTSGTTGQPKGVQISHGNLLALLDAVCSGIGFHSDMKAVLLSTMTFDIAIAEVLVPLIMGMSVYIADSEERRCAFKGEAALKKANVLQTTASRVEMYLQNDANRQILSDYELVMLSGEPLPENLFSRLKALVKGRIINLYGPTETTIWVTWKDVTEDKTVTIGKAMRGTSLVILSPEGEEVSPGETGELWIGGDNVSPGYLNRPELNKEFFNLHPDKGRLYKSGDIVRLHPDGNYECLGRVDDQVKIRGYRVELKEIEEVLGKMKGVRQVVVKALKDSQGSSLLAAYVVFDDLSCDCEGMKEDLAQVLPEYMVPGYIVPLNEFPLTPNGKVDKKSLPDPLSVLHEKKEKAEAENEIQEDVLQVWRELLDYDNIGIHDDFMDLGGYSLLVMKLANRIHKIFGVELSFKDILVYARTVAAMAELIEEKLLDMLGDEELESLLCESVSEEGY